MDVTGLIIYEEAPSPARKGHEPNVIADFIPWLCVCRTNLLNRDLYIPTAAFMAAAEHYFGKGSLGDVSLMFPGVVLRAGVFDVSGCTAVKTFFSNTERMAKPSPLFAGDADQLETLRKFVVHVLGNPRPWADGSIACHLLYDRFREWYLDTRTKVANDLLFMEWLHVLGVKIQEPTTSATCWRWDFRQLFDYVKKGYNMESAVRLLVAAAAPPPVEVEVCCKVCGKTGAGVYKIYTCRDLYRCHGCIKSGPLLSPSCTDCGAPSQARHLKRYGDRFASGETSICKRCGASVGDQVGHIVAAHNIKTPYVEHGTRIEEIGRKRKRLEEELAALAKDEEALVKSKKESETEMNQDLVYFFGKKTV